MRYELFEEVSSIGSKDIREQHKGGSAIGRWKEPAGASPTLLAACERHFSINWNTYGSLYHEDSGLAARYLSEGHESNLLTQVEALVTHPNRSCVD